ncbi:MAG: DUF3106 domain-containing protein [Desulfobacteraceae bacterium]|nr:DUF3106 domain-containing protein [Desulfobacteraceae bacterium]
MMRDKYRSLKYLKPLTVVLAFVLIILFSSPSLSFSRSKNYNEADQYHRTQKTYKETAPNHRQFIDYRDRQTTYPPTDRGRQLLLQVKNYKRGYNKLSPEEKKMLKRKYRQWQSMPEERQEILRQRMEKWKQLPSEEREHMQERFQQWQKLPPEERERTREKLRKWNALPPEEKEQILQKFRGPGSKRRP